MHLYQIKINKNKQKSIRKKFIHGILLIDSTDLRLILSLLTLHKIIFMFFGVALQRMTILNLSLWGNIIHLKHKAILDIDKIDRLPDLTHIILLLPDFLTIDIDMFYFFIFINLVQIFIFIYLQLFPFRYIILLYHQVHIVVECLFYLILVLIC